MQDAPAQQLVTAAFDDLAPAYDRFRTGYAPELYDALFEYGLATGARVLDVATGTGLVAAELVARGCTVAGLDASEPMLACARRRVPGAAFVSGQAERLPFADRAFDAVVCAQAFHWFEREAALAESIRVVRPGGVVAVWWKSLMRGDTVRLLREESEKATGVEPLPELMATGFAEFERSPLLDQRLRVIPWLVRTRVADFLGYEASRARPKAFYGARAGAYFANLSARLGDPADSLALSYVHFLYLGRVHGAA
jgi:ubiquinone/menaquinone biosynthesis C-methylase UbiE